MFPFANRDKAVCVDFGAHSVLVAKVSQFEPPLVIEELKEFSPEDTKSLTAYLGTVHSKGTTGYAQALCGIYPSKRIVRRQAIDPRRFKDTAYFNELLSSQLRIEPNKYALKVLNAEDGSDYDGVSAVKLAQKDVLFAGMPIAELDELQDTLLSLGFYPEKIELGTLATIGALTNYLNFKDQKSPILYLEIGAESTHSFIVGAKGLESSRPISSGIADMVPLVQKELGLKDEESARKLFYSNTFDFTGMGPTLTRKLVKELQSSIGYYEVQTGQSIGGVISAHLPPALAWFGTAVAQALGVGPVQLDLRGWIESRGVTFAEGIELTAPDERWLSLLALLADYRYAALQAETNQ